MEEFDYAWKHSEAPMHFTLERPEGYDDPGDFIRIRIQVKGRPEYVLNNEDGWVEYNNQEEKSEVYAQLKDQNLVQSKYVLILPDGKSKNRPPLVFLRSWGYASSAERLHVIGFMPSGTPITLINNGLDLVELIDLDGDGYQEIVGQPCLGEVVGSEIETYAPYQVYKVPHPVTSEARVSLALSRAYNLKHYYGWAGPECNQELRVVLHPPSGGKPLILHEDEADRLMEKARRMEQK